jgi:OOP family OmpA-OmpF porin
MTIKKTSRHSTPNCAAPSRPAARSNLRAGAGVLMTAWLAAILAAAPVLAADKPVADRKGGVDNPVLSRFKGSVLYMYGDSRLDKASVVAEQKGKPVLLPVEGKVSNRLYLAPEGSSPLEVYRNYRQALEAAGFETLYACDAAACEKARVQSLIQDLPRKAHWASYDNAVEGTFNSGNQPAFHYYSGQRKGPGGLTYVSIGIVGGYPNSGVMSRQRQFVQIIEPAVTELGKVEVDAKAITAGLKRDGKIALYGINFDTNKAVLREDSAGQLGEMAGVLKATPALKVFIVGHTDNQGEFAANTGLSQKRAEAVAAALASKYGIAPARLVARGVANLAPVSTNDSEEGRARNRRVEMVVR